MRAFLFALAVSATTAASLAPHCIKQWCPLHTGADATLMTPSPEEQVPVFVVLPFLNEDKLDETFMMVNVVTVANIIAAVLCLVFQRYLVRLCFVRATLLVPFILAAMVMGASFSNLSLGDIGFFAAAGMAGYIFKHMDWPRVPMVMGLILGGIAEPYFFAAWDRYGLTWLYERPIVLILEMMILFMLFSKPIRRLLLDRYGREAKAND